MSRACFPCREKGKERNKEISLFDRSVRSDPALRAFHTGEAASARKPLPFLQAAGIFVQQKVL
jgi:hypothetical protein